MISENKVKRYCCDDLSKIENYDKAITDMENTWYCHHRLEIGKNGERISYKDLISHGLYYNRPPEELILLTKSEHVRLHHIGKEMSEYTRRKISEANSGKKLPPRSEEYRRKMSLAKKAYWAKRKMAGR